MLCVSQLFHVCWVGSVSVTLAGGKTPRLDSAARKISEFFPSKPQVYSRKDTFTQVCVCVGGGGCVCGVCVCVGRGVCGVCVCGGGGVCGVCVCVGRGVCGVCVWGGACVGCVCVCVGGEGGCVCVGGREDVCVCGRGEGGCVCVWGVCVGVGCLVDLNVKFCCLRLN